MNSFIRLFTHSLTLARYIFLETFQSYISHSLSLFLQLFNPFVCAFVCLFVLVLIFFSQHLRQLQILQLLHPREPIPVNSRNQVFVQVPRAK